jgi:hypothetical protein
MNIATALAIAGLSGVLLIEQADANNRRYRDDGGYYRSTSPRVIRERQRHRHTFDETQYYERLSEKIPLGTDAWWRQRQLENPVR